MPSRLFLSDLHLEDPHSPAALRFQECLALESHRVDEIYILGDLVEMWVGDDDNSAIAVLLRDALQEAAKYSRVFLMHGNRDFLMGERFAREAEITLLPDPFCTPDGLLLSHGDRYCTDDTKYQAARAMLRSEQWQNEILAKTLAERTTLGQMLRAQSRQENANKATNIMDTNPVALKTAIDEHQAMGVIHGHTHRPEASAGQTFKFVLGAWERCGWVLREHASRFSLECFALNRPYTNSESDKGTPL